MGKAALSNATPPEANRIRGTGDFPGRMPPPAAHALPALADRHEQPEPEVRTVPGGDRALDGRVKGDAKSGARHLAPRATAVLAHRLKLQASELTPAGSNPIELRHRPWGGVSGGYEQAFQIVRRGADPFAARVPLRFASAICLRVTRRYKRGGRFPRPDWRRTAGSRQSPHFRRCRKGRVADRGPHVPRPAARYAKRAWLLALNPIGA